MWTVDKIKQLLQENDKAVERALLVLLSRQTHDERTSMDTRYRNNRGFTQADARIFTSMAEQVQAGRRLSPRQLNFLRSGKSQRFPSRIGKYARQLLEEVKIKEGA